MGKYLSALFRLQLDSDIRRRQKKLARGAKLQVFALVLY